MDIFILQPWLAGLVGLLFLGAWVWRKQKISLITAIAWLIYCAYEYSMFLQIGCSGDCNIRIDLLLIYPILIALLLYAIFRIIIFKKSTD